MEKLRYGGFASLKTDVGKNVKSFPTKHVFTTLLLMLLCMMLPKTAWAAYSYETATYDFGTAAKTAGATITMSSTSYPALGSVAKYGETLAYGNNTVDISKFAFRYVQNDQGWYLRDMSSSNAAQYGLFVQYGSSTQNFAICNLHAGDKVTITFTGDLLYESGAPGYNASVENGRLYWNKTIKSGVEYTITQDGDMIIKPNNHYTYIYTISIQTLQTKATFSITTQEDTNNNTRSTTFAFTGEGRMEGNAVAVPFMEVEFGSEQNGVMVSNTDAGLASSIPDLAGYTQLWFENNLPYQGTFYKFSPTAKGKLQIKGYLSGGTIYLYEENNGTLTQKASVSGSGSVSLPVGWATLEKGKTYYVCDDPSNRSYNTFQLHEFTYTNEFNMALGKVLENGATSGELASVKGASSLDNWSVKRVSSNINATNISVSYANNTLSISGIAYNDESADKAGVIILDLEFDAGVATFVVTIPYSAEKGHKWDFYTNVLEIGQYKTAGSQLQQETDNGEWQYTHRVINQQGVGTHDPMYKNVYDMEGDNADMIWETEGLWFDTPTYKSCLYNEIDADAQATYTKGENTWTGPAYTDRYVGILPGGSFTIPGLKKNDRVIIYMGSGDGSGNDVCFLNITNARDAIGQSISSTDTYKAGGSLWNGDNSDYALRGCYHFIAAADGPMTFTMNGGSMTKLYTIEIYQGDHKYTDDAGRVTLNYDGTSYNANSYQLANDYKSDAKNAAFQLHYRGKGDGLRNPTVLYKTGTVGTGTDKLFYQTITSSNGSVNHYILFKSTKGEFGMFRMRIDMMEQNGKYVGDYGLQNVSVGYLEKKDYPYTWDFTDLSGYCSEKIAADITASTAYDTAVSATDKYDTGGDPLSEFMNRQSPIENNGPYYNTVALWKEYSDDFGSGYGLQVRNNYYANNNSNEGSGELTFTSGSQLFAGDSFIAEAAGLGLIARGSESKRNGRLRITEDGLFLYEQQNDYWRVRIPEVPSTSAVYVRAKEIPGRSNNVKVTVGDANTIPTYAKKISEDEWVYAMKGTGEDMTFFFSNVIVEKIAVSEDAKKVNSKGWTSESRDHNIDASLTAYMTGKDIKTYLVSNPDYKNRTLTLTDVGADASNYVLPANTGCVMYNATDNAAANILDGGFHLFVPDMHDTEKVYNVTETNNLLTPNVETEGLSLGMGDGGNTNYVLAYKYQQLKEDGTPYGDVMEGPEMFYRVSKSGIKLHKNSAYLQLPTEKVKPSENNTTGSAKFTFIFADELENDSQATGIEDASVKRETGVSEQSVWYNLNGQKLNGKPQQRGLYIVNGKKVLFK